MTASVFTDVQARHAALVVLSLIKRHRFFLYQRGERHVDDEEVYKLDPIVFAEAIEVDRRLQVAHADAARVAASIITGTEFALDIVPADLSGNRQLVQCNRYTGGLDICSVLPLTDFLPFAPVSPQALREEVSRILMRGTTRDNYSPVQWQAHEESVRTLADVIWGQLGAMRADDPDNKRCVVITRTRFDPQEGHREGDFMEGRVAGMQKYPHALGFLFHAYSAQERLVPPSHVVFSTSRTSHVNAQYWKERLPSLNFAQRSGYACKIHFVTVL